MLTKTSRTLTEYFPKYTRRSVNDFNESRGSEFWTLILPLGSTKNKCMRFLHKSGLFLNLVGDFCSYVYIPGLKINIIQNNKLYDREQLVRNLTDHK